MSTRSVIKIEGIENAAIYKHWDGYPRAMLPWLESFNKTFAEKRGDDASYKFAQLLRSSVRDSKTFNLDDSELTGWGVIGYDDKVGQEFTYTLKTNGTVLVNGKIPDDEIRKE